MALSKGIFLLKRASNKSKLFKSLFFVPSPFPHSQMHKPAPPPQSWGIYTCCIRMWDRSRMGCYFPLRRVLKETRYFEHVGWCWSSMFKQSFSHIGFINPLKGLGPKHKPTTVSLRVIIIFLNCAALLHFALVCRLCSVSLYCSICQSWGFLAPSVYFSCLL